jgi:hypothetical protein
MNYLEILLSWLTLAIEIVLCGLVFARRAQKVLPFFSSYALFLLARTLGVWLVYKAFGFESQAAYYCYWASLIVIALMRSLAIAELCRLKLGGYRGIWRLAWRLLLGVSVLLFLHAAFDTWGQLNRLAIYSLTLDRDLDIASVAILAALLLIHNYYELSLEPLQRAIAAGICFICAMDVVGDTILQSLFTGYLLPFFSAAPSRLALKPDYDRVNSIWSTVHLACFMVSLAIWCYALRKPIPERAEAPALIPAEVYEEMSPAINLRLRAFNDRLVEMLKS